jgi:D-alanyl-lipoteichoic acid acyltransferase DltB (MBOAT superfamily)
VGELNLPRYGLFVTFFPHLIAGPIVHHYQLMPQFGEAGAKRCNASNVHIGLAFFVIGLFFAVLHLGVLMLASGGLSPMMGVYVAGLMLALVALILG